jgi:dipeptidase E
LDLDTYKEPMLKLHGAKKSSPYDEGTSTTHNPQDPQSNPWSYIRVEGLGILPGLVCPHFDRIQSNGVPRLVDFDSMMKRHSMELGLGIDHFAALEINGEDFRVLSLPGEKGSVPQEDDSVPGAWIKYVDEDGDLQSMPCPSFGKVEDLLQVMVDPSKHIWPDERVQLCRVENPGPSMD